MHQLGSTRSVSRREYLLHTPDAFVRTPLPEIQGGAAVVHIAPRMGAGFCMMTVELESSGLLAPGTAQRFVFVLEGEVHCRAQSAGETQRLTAGSFCYLPAPSTDTLHAARPSRLVVIDKPYTALPDAAAPGPLFGHEQAIASSALNGDETLQVRSLLPASRAFDFAVNTMTYAPGASLSQVEVHYMEHGLLMLEGGGTYRLGDEWHPVTAGDVIWMAPFCPQWFAAAGKGAAKYLIYKDFNRHPLA